MVYGLGAAQRAPFSPESAVQGFWGPLGVQSHTVSCPSGQVITIQFNQKQSFSIGSKVILVTMALWDNIHCCLQVSGTKEKPVPVQHPA